MSKLTVIGLVGVLAAGCVGDSSSPTAPMAVPVFESQDVSANANGGNFGTPLSSEEEVMPPGVVNDSRARGSAIFTLNAEGTELQYQLIVANIENVFMAHIHMAPAGVNGGIVVWLFPSTAVGPGPTGQGRVQGPIARGVITGANLVGGLGGQPLSALIDAISAGNTYVNVHTNDGDAVVNTGPGDFPGGEIRGQVEHRGH